MMRLGYLLLISTIIWLLAGVPALSNAGVQSVVKEEENPYQLAKQSVVFIYPPGGEPCVNTAQPLAAGTGFFVGLILLDKDNKTTGKKFQYLITNKHVINSFDSVILRLNNRANSHYVCHEVPLIRSGPHQNVFPSTQTEVDLVAIWCPDIEDTWPLALDYSMLLNEDDLRDLELTEGTAVFTIGYFFGYAGLEKNYPVIRSGKMSLVTEEKWLNLDGQRQHAYLAELGITGGASGSPVLLEPSQYRVTQSGQMQGRNVGPRVIGVVKAYPNLPASVIDNSGKEIGLAKVSNGLAIIEPGHYLKELLKSLAEALIKSGYRIHGFSNVQSEQGSPGAK